MNIKTNLKDVNNHMKLLHENKIRKLKENQKMGLNQFFRPKTM